MLFRVFTIYRGSAWLRDISVLPKFWDFQNLQIYRNSKMIVLCYNTGACIPSNACTMISQKPPFLYYCRLLIFHVYTVYSNFHSKDYSTF